jgi:hypothetical protein
MRVKDAMFAHDPDPEEDDDLADDDPDATPLEDPRVWYIPDAGGES